MATDVLKEAMQQYQPELEKDYKQFVQSTFKSMVADLGPNLKGVYNSWRWARTYRGIRDSITKDQPPGTCSMRDYDSAPARIDEAKLGKSAKLYAEAVALEWYYKTREKLGDLTGVTVSEPGRNGLITVRGRAGSSSVVMEQRPIINVSSLGTAFHQFPARIYVDGKFHSEAAYKKTIRGLGVKEIVRERKPKRAPIDPNSRPKRYFFEFKVDRPATQWRPAATIGEKQSEDARGMAENEAWDKIYRRAMRDGYFSRVYDPVVVKIRAWNDVLLWTASSGEPRPDIPAGPEVEDMDDTPGSPFEPTTTNPKKRAAHRRRPDPVQTVVSRLR